MLYFVNENSILTVFVPHQVMLSVRRQRGGLRNTLDNSTTKSLNPYN